MSHSHCPVPVEMGISALTRSLQWRRVEGLGHFECLLFPEPEENSSMLGEDLTPQEAMSVWA